MFIGVQNKISLENLENWVLTIQKYQKLLNGLQKTLALIQKNMNAKQKQTQSVPVQYSTISQYHWNNLSSISPKLTVTTRWARL